MLSMCLLFCFVIFWILCYVMCEKKKKKMLITKKKTMEGLLKDVNEESAHSSLLRF